MEPRNSRMLVMVALLLFLISPFSVAQQYDTADVRKLNRSATAFLNKNPDSLLFYAQQAKKVAETIQDYVGLADAWGGIGAYFYVKGEHKNAIDAYHEMLDLSVKRKYNLGVIKAYNNLALTFQQLGDYSKSIHYHVQALQLIEPSDDEKSKAIIYTNLGNTYKLIKDYQSALENMKLANSIFTKLKMHESAAITLNALGSIYLDSKDYKQAFTHFNHALHIYDSLDLPAGIARSNVYLGSIMLTQNELEQAAHYCHTAISVGKKYGYNQTLIEAYQTLGQVYQAQHKINQSIEAYSQGIALASKGDYKKRLADLYLGLSECYELSMDNVNALHALKKYTTLSDSIFNQENFRSINNLKISYEVEKKDAEIEILKKDKQIAELSKRNLTIIIIALVLIATIIILALRQKIKKDKQLRAEKEKLEEVERERVRLELENMQIEIESKNRELTSYTLHLIQKNELLNELKSDLKNLRDRFTLDSKPKVASLVNRIQVAHDIDREWENFKTYFEGVHLGFFDNLKMSNPDLSTSDLKLCALLRMNLENKQIAAILDIAPESVKIARHRLKKKLNVDRDEDLSSFLASALN